MELYQVVILVVGIVLLGLICFAYYYKKNYLSYSKMVTPIVEALHNVIKGVGNIFPDNKVISAISTIMTASIEAAGYAENMWLQGEIEKHMRPQYAQHYIEILLEKAGIEITDSVSAIIAGTIAIACYLMPHYSEGEE